MRVAVVGAGAIGCTLGGLLAARGAAEVELVARGEQARALAGRGLRLEGPWGTHHLRLPVAARVTRRPDLLVLAVKTQDLDAAAADAAPVARGATALTVQNGLAADGIAARHLGAEHVVGAVTHVIATFATPGLVRADRVDSLLLGRPEGAPDERVAEVAALLRAAGVPAPVTANLRGARWTKLLVNLNNALPAATGLPVQELYARPALAAAAARMLKEGLAVARAEAVRLEGLPSASPALLALLPRLPDVLAGRVLRARVRRVGSAGPILGSTLQSLRRGRPTEIDHLNGEVVRRGAALGLPVPVNTALVEAVKTVEAGGPFLGPRELAARLAARGDAPIGI